MKFLHLFALAVFSSTSLPCLGTNLELEAVLFSTERTFDLLTFPSHPDLSSISYANESENSDASKEIEEIVAPMRKQIRLLRKELVSGNKQIRDLKKQMIALQQSASTASSRLAKLETEDAKKQVAVNTVMDVRLFLSMAGKSTFTSTHDVQRHQFICAIEINDKGYKGKEVVGLINAMKSVYEPCRAQWYGCMFSNCYNVSIAKLLTKGLLQEYSQVFFKIYTVDKPNFPKL